MNKLLLYLFLIVPILGYTQGGPDCASMEPICTVNGLTFTANSGVPEASTADPGNDYGCLITRSNPTWYYFDISSNGNIGMSRTAPSDTDFVIWGPFASLSDAQANCGVLGNPSANNIIDCSFTYKTPETVIINELICF